MRSTICPARSCASVVNSCAFVNTVKNGCSHTRPKADLDATKRGGEVEKKRRGGEKGDTILRALVFSPFFRYEKFRAEWSDGTGHVVLDRTPIGDFGEIEGPPRWIDRTAQALGIAPPDYLTQTYADLFFTWKRRSR